MAHRSGSAHRRRPAAAGAIGTRVATQLLNVLAACDVERGLIVLDDAHRVSDPAVFEFLDVLLERLPPHWGVSSRAAPIPPLASLARLRAHGELAEFRQRELRFTLDEVRALLPARAATQAALDSEATSQRLYQRTHGWAVGLRLAVNGIRAGHDAQAVIDDTVNDRHVFDYLLNEVLGELPLPLRCFLLRCSVLDELTAGRCAAVSADPRAAEWLEEIERRGLFVSVLQGARRRCGCTTCSAISCATACAARWPTSCRRCIAAPRRARPTRCAGSATRSAPATGARPRKTLREAGATIIATVGVAPVLRLLEKFPAEARRTSANLLHMRCLAAWSRWDWATMRESAAAARAAFLRAGDSGWPGARACTKSIALVTAGDHDEARRRRRRSIRASR